MKKYVLIAGVNGAGKSTLFQTIDSLKDMKRVNTDEIVRGFGDWHSAKDVIKAGKIAVKLINDYFSKGISFNQETTLCGSRIIRKNNKPFPIEFEKGFALCILIFIEKICQPFYLGVLEFSCGFGVYVQSRFSVRVAKNILHSFKVHSCLAHSCSEGVTKDVIAEGRQSHIAAVFSVNDVVVAVPDYTSESLVEGSLIE